MEVSYINDILSWANHVGTGLFVVFLRVGAAMAVLPAFGERTVSIRVRLALAVAFTAIVWTLLNDADKVQVFRPVLFASEPVIGLAVGLFFRFFVIALQVVGTIAAQATSLSQIFGAAATSDPLPALGNLLVVAGFALAMANGLHVKLALALSQTYVALPAGILPMPTDVSAWGVRGASRTFTVAFSLAAPFVILSLIYNFALGAINRAMPQLMVAFIGAPIITAAGLGLIAVTAPAILTLWQGYLDQALSSPFEPLR